MEKKTNVNKVLIVAIVVLVLINFIFLGIMIGKGFSSEKVKNNDLNTENVSNNTESVEKSNGIKEEQEKISEDEQDNRIENIKTETDNKNELEAVSKNKDKVTIVDNKTEEKIENKKEIKNEEKTETVVETNNNSNQNSNSANGKIIVIDPGHQVKGNSAQEPIGPGATETKAKVTGGATGVATKQTEYALNLKVALLLQQKLQAKGYTVIMTRTTNEVNISNKERAEIANNANAAAFIRIHANSLNDQSVKGILTMCQTANNQYNGYLAEKSYKLSKLVLDNVINTTGGVNKGVTRTDTMSGINWCTVPTTIIEMGFLSNQEEDRLLATDSYQEKIVDGIVQGIEEFLK